MNQDPRWVERLRSISTLHRAWAVIKLTCEQECPSGYDTRVSDGYKRSGGEHSRVKQVQNDQEPRPGELSETEGRDVRRLELQGQHVRQYRNP